ncbi:MAG: hypothetical protein Q4E13_02430 [Clostridia bacterium]|nr:hypothetical protein [Clostridia bacterium]
MNSLERELKPHIQSFIDDHLGNLVREGERSPEAQLLKGEMMSKQLEVEKDVGKFKVQDLVDAVRNVDYAVEEYVYRTGLSEGAALAEAILHMLGLQ